MKKTALAIIFFALGAGIVFSVDFGLILENNFEAENKYYSYTPSLYPWFSYNNGQGLSLFFSGLMSLKYNNYDDGISDNDGLRKPYLLPELSRFYFVYRSGQRSFEAGRIDYVDALGQTASGLFDGLRFQTATIIGNVSASAYYTGFLYKETAEILMTANDKKEYAKPVESFSDYCASKRIFAAVRLDMPLFEYHNFIFETIAQFDMNDSDEKLNSQYAQVVLEYFTRNNIKISGGFVFEMKESSGGDASYGAACGALAAVETDLPGSPNDNLKLSAKYSSGPSNETFNGFIPISSVAQGMVFSEIFSGLWQAKVNYEVRILPSLFAETAISYFGRTYNEADSEGSLYGGEVRASFAWQPLEDIRAVLGGGIFMPETGNVYPAGTDIMWKINAGLLISF